MLISGDDEYDEGEYDVIAAIKCLLKNQVDESDLVVYDESEYLTKLAEQVNTFGRDPLEMLDESLRFIGLQLNRSA